MPQRRHKRQIWEAVSGAPFLKSRFTTFSYLIMSFGVAISSSHTPYTYIRIYQDHVFQSHPPSFRPTESWPCGSQWSPVDPSGTGHTAASNASPASAPPAGSAGLPPPLAQKSSLPRKRGIQLIMAIPPGTSHAKEIQHEKQSNLTRNSTKQSAFEHVFLLRLGEEGLNTS